MKRFTLMLTVALMTSVGTAAHAQGYVWVGGAATVPIADSKTVMNTGWLADAGYGRAIRKSRFASWQLQGMVGGNSAKAGYTNTTLYGALLNLSFGSSVDARFGGYFNVGGGVLSAKAQGTSSYTNGAFQAIGGGFIALNPKLSLFGEIRYLAAGGNSNLTLMPIAIGLSKAIGGP